MTDYTLGLDLNHYRKNVPLKQAKAQGVRFLIGKCTEGEGYVDETYHPYKLEAKNKALPFGGYMYWRVIYDAVGQAAHYVSTLGDTEFPPLVDVERFNNVKYGTNIPLYSHNTNVNHLQIVLNEVERLTDRKPMIYTSKYAWEVLTGNHPMIGDYGLWVANYGRIVPLLPVGATDWILWQFTSTYKIIGYYRGVDANWYHGNEGEFEAWIESMKPPPPPPPTVYLPIILKLGERLYDGEVIEV
jgi:lysozyme